MTLFEYLTVAVSVVLALGLVRLVEGLGSAFATARRYWVHLTLVVSLIVTHLYYWWLLWLFHEGVRWNFGSFVFVILGALLLYFAAGALIPRDPTAVRSWKDHYFSMHRRLFLVAAAFPLHASVMVYWLREEVLTGAVLVAAVCGFGLNLVGAFTASERVHQGLALGIGGFVLCVVVLWGGGIGPPPG